MKKILLLFLLATIAFACSDKDDNDFAGNSGVFTDERDGQRYKWIRIGDQIWMAENLNATIFIDGSPITLAEDDNEWTNLSDAGYCWYNNNKIDNSQTYGALYNGYAASNPKISPSGWHVATSADWQRLFDFLGEDAAGKLKENGNVLWANPNTGATNESNFNARPGGRRDSENSFNSMGRFGYWWTSSSGGGANFNCIWITNNSSSVSTGNVQKYQGMSIRCVKD